MIIRALGAMAGGLCREDHDLRLEYLASRVSGRRQDSHMIIMRRDEAGQLGRGGSASAPGRSDTEHR